MAAMIPTVRQLPERDYLGLKKRWRELVKLCGGPADAVRLTRGSESRVSEAGAPDKMDRFPALDQIADLEADCGKPVVTEMLADLLGYNLVPREGLKGTVTVADAAVNLVKQIAAFQVMKAEAEADGKLTKDERAHIEASLQHLISKAHDLIIALREDS